MKTRKVNCAICGTAFDTKFQNKYCSAECMRQYHSIRAEARTLAKKEYPDALPCEVCGSSVRIHRHHDDYRRPLDITWLCDIHHFEWHRNNVSRPTHTDIRQHISKTVESAALALSQWIS